MAEQIPFSIAENLLMKLGSVAFQEIGLMYGVKSELIRLGEKLSMVKAVLLDAEKQQETSHAVAEWVRRLKAVVYDADDLFDDFSTEDLRRKTDVQGRCAGQVSDFFSSSNHLAFRFMMGHRIKDIRERLDDIANDKSQFNFTPGVITDEVPNRQRETHSFEIASDMIGRGENENEIVELLMKSRNEENVSVVAIVGIGGLGKTSLAQLTYNNDGVVKHFELRMWICVSDVFDVKLLVGNIIKSASNQETQNLSFDRLQQSLRGILNGKRYLLVLDDVWNEDPGQWNELRKLLMDGCNGSKILVTTRSSKVASAMGVDFPYVLEGLNEYDSWLLFKKLAFKQDQEQVNQNLTSIGKEIVNKCKGVPLVIKVLASALRSQTRENQWLSIRNNENLTSLDEDKKILSVLKLSYEALPAHLKQCFSYCALFPKDYQIERDLLVQLWMAQGYIQCEGQSLEEVGEQYFEELSQRSFFQEIRKDGDGNIISCKMHDFIHDLAQSLVKNEVSILTDVSNDITERVRHVSLINGGINCWEVLRAKSIRTSLLLGFGFGWSLGSSFGKIRCQYLRALDLSHTGISEVPKCLSKLSHLRYLDLSWNRFDKLPNFITRLQNLQTLKLLSCRELKELPRDIRKLMNLRHLLIDYCPDMYSLTHMPCGLGELTELRTLPYFVVGKGKAIGSLSELKRLNHLQGKLVITNLENVRDATLQSKEGNLKGKQYLRSLQLFWEAKADANRIEDAELVMEGLHPNSNLKKLLIYGYGGVTFPSWLMNDGLNLLLPNLVKIQIQRCERCRELPLLDQLPSLQYLQLSYLSEVEHTKESSSTSMPFFPSLKSLNVYELPNWKGWWRRGLSFPCLSQLEIRYCHKLTSFGQSSFPCVSRLDIWSCPKITSFSLSSFPCLEELDLGEVSKEQLAQSTLVFSSLKKLWIRHMDDMVSLLEEGIRCLTSLNYLHIHGCGSLKSLSPGIQHLTALETLEIYRCSEFDFPDTEYTDMLFRGLGSLRHLSLYLIPKLERLPKGLQHVTTLQTLSIRSCDAFITLPDWIASLTSLASLQLFECKQLKSLPEGMGSMTSLHKLEISNCPHLVQRCKKGATEDWPKISHIPTLRIW